MIDKLLLEHLGLPHVLDLAVHLVNYFGWMSPGGHSETLLPLALFSRALLHDGPCDFSVSPSSFGLDFGTLDFGLGLDKNLDLELSLKCSCLTCFVSALTNSTMLPQSKKKRRIGSHTRKLFSRENT